MTFGDLALLVLAGLAGPLLAAGRLFVPVVIGEIIAGLIVGPHVVGLLNPSQPTVSFLADVGFAMLMFTVGMHVPLRDRQLGDALARGAAAAALVGLVAPLAALLVGVVSGAHHLAIYAVLIASGSAAAVLPMFDERGLSGRAVAVVTAQITIADVVTIVAVPLVLQPSRAGRAAVGGLAVVAAAVGVYAVAGKLRGRGVAIRLRQLSRRRHWALDLRLSLLVLFGLAWIAQRTRTSTLIAGFSAGLIVAAFGGPKRLSRQVLGVSQGLFVPLFFVVLGARLDPGGVARNPRMLALAASLVVLSAAAHMLAARLTRQTVGAALAATAQLGVPAAVASLGIHARVLTAPQGSAIVLAALVSLGVAALGVELLARAERRSAPPQESAGEPVIARAAVPLSERLR